MNKNIIVGGVLAFLLLIGGVFAASSDVVQSKFHGRMKGDLKNIPAEMQEQHDAIQTAFENNDYNAWKALMENQTKERYNHALEMITPENFDNHKAIHDAMEAGDMDKVKELREEYGLMGGPGGFGGKGMRGRGEHRNHRNECPNAKIAAEEE